MDARRLPWIGAAVLLAAGLAVRLWHVGSEPLWLDEAYSGYAAAHGFDFLWHVVPRYETHPPFYYSLLRLWTLAFGDGVTALRLPGVLAGLATLPLLVVAADAAARLLGWDAVGRARTGAAALALGAVSIPLVEMSRQVRPYPLMILAYAGAIVLLLRLAARTRRGAPLAGGSYAGCLLLLEALLWLHNMGPLFGLALVLALACAVLRPGLGRADWAWLVGGHALVAAAYLPGLLILADQAPTWVRSTWLRFGLDGLRDHLPMLYASPGWPLLAAPVLVGLAARAAWGLAAGRRLIALLLVLALVPVIASVILSLTVAPVFITRTMTPAAVPALLLFALGTGAFVRGVPAILGLGGALILALNMLAVDVQARLAGPMQDWRGAVAWLAPRFRPGDAILAYPNEGALPLAYALRDAGLAYPIRPIPGPVPTFDVAGGWYPTGSRGVVSLPRPALHAIATAPQTRAIPTIWLLRLGAATYDPGDVFLDELHQGRRVVRRFVHGPIDIVGLARVTPASAPPRNPR